MSGIDQTAILSRLRSLVRDRIDIDPELLMPGASLRDIGIDSFAFIELVFLAEEEFGIRIPLDGTPPQTVDDVVAVISGQLPAT